MKIFDVKHESRAPQVNIISTVIFFFMWYGKNLCFKFKFALQTLIFCLLEQVRNCIEFKVSKTKIMWSSQHYWDRGNDQ